MYKYSKREHAKLLTNLGVLRIGTLHDFQSSQHGSGIFDSAEGTKTLTHSAVKPLDIVVGRHGDTKILDDFCIGYEAGATFKAFGKNVKTILNHSTANCFVYCVSSVSSKTVMAEFDGANACIEISDMQSFLEVLTDALNSVCPVEFVEVNSVEYVARHSEWHFNYENIHPAWIKDPVYGKQHEWRAIWNPLLPGPISPVITGHTGLTSLVRLIDPR